MDLNTGVFLTVIFCLITFWILWRKRRLNLFERYRIPGPKPNFWFGNLKDIIEKREDCLKEWAKKYGKIVGFYLGAKPMIVCTDVEFLKLMQIKEYKNFMNKDLILPDGGISHKSIFKALIFLHDQKWKDMRSFFNTSFSTGKIRKMSSIATNTIKIFMKKLQEKKKENFDILLDFKQLTFDIICKASFGVTTDVQTNKTDKFTQSVYNAFSVDTADSLASISICFPEIEPIPTKLRSLIDACKYFLNLPSIRVIVETCSNIIESRKKLETKPEDLLQSMIDVHLSNNGVNQNKQISMPQERLVGNSMSFMLAGYETTSSTLGYCAYLLATHPHIQEKARDEINRHIKKENEIQYTDLANLQYLDQVISETLRLFPLAFTIINRICAADFKYKDITIPKDTIVIVPIWTLHRDRDYWVDADKFVPERFSPENRGNIDQLVYQPFGAGPRICIGMRFAMTIMKIILANLIRSYKLESTQTEKDLNLEHKLFFIRPKNGIIVKITPL